MSEQQDILHCPFCGSEAKAYASHYANLGEHWVICLSPNCGGKTHWWPSREQAIAAWNKRVVDPEKTTGFDAWYQAILAHVDESCDGCPLDGKCRNLSAVGMPCEIAPLMLKIETALRQLYEDRGRR